ncbi:MAG: hypothetical protein WBX01_02740 [Nitrososphaeraceae archaeon]
MDYLRGTETVWRCNECIQYYDTKIQDTPITNNNKFKVTPHSDISRYPKIDDEDTNIPFVKGVNLNLQEEERNSNIEKTTCG